MRPTVVALLGLLLPFTALAMEARPGPHQHGVGQLNLAVDGNEIEIELTLPGMDVVGFEHAAASDADRTAVTQAIVKLRDGGKLFRFAAAGGCRLEQAEVGQNAHEHGQHEQAKGKEHKHEHAKAKEHEPAKGEEDEHAEFRAHYHFDCKNPAGATPLDVRVFEILPTAERIDTQRTSPRGQGGAGLTPASTRLDF